MRILLIGAYGFIGSEIARALHQDGHEIVGLGRDLAYGQRVLPFAQWRQGDLSHLVKAEDWAPYLTQIDGVINASGLLQSGAGDHVSAVQQDAILALIAAARTAGIQLMVQISAAGADADACIDFLRTKRIADDALAASGLAHVILRPALVIGRNSYGGTELLRMAAAQTGVAFYPATTARIQTVAMADVVEAVRIALAHPGPLAIRIDLAAPEPHRLIDIISAHRLWLGLGPPLKSVALPRWSMVLLSKLADFLGHFGWRSPLRHNAVMALTDGVVARSAEANQWLGRAPLSLADTLALHPAGKQDRVHAHLMLLLPVMLIALFLLWFGSGVLGLIRTDEAATYLTEAGFGSGIARAVVISGAITDIMLALALVSRRWARPALIGMILVTFAYLVGGALWRPDLWIEPLAPLLKSIPSAALAAVAYSLLEKR